MILVLKFSVCLVLLAISIQDIKRREVPDGSLVLLFLMITQYVYLNEKTQVLERLLEGVIVYGIFLSAGVTGKIGFRRKIIGGGDLKLILCLTVLLGIWNMLDALMIACLLSGIFLLTVFLKEHRLPVFSFVPFVTAGVWISVRFPL